MIRQPVVDGPCAMGVMTERKTAGRPQGTIRCEGHVDDVAVQEIAVFDECLPGLTLET